ncbi:MAG: HU family DNA-binding protein [Nitrospirota bacterium]
MTKAELIEKLANKIDGINKREAEIIVNAFFDSIVNALVSNDKVEVRGFGIFKLRSRKERDGRNPKTGLPVSVPAKLVPFFKAGKELKEMVDGKNSGWLREMGFGSRQPIVIPNNEI